MKPGMSDRPVSLLGVAGSLRAGSWNKKLLAAAGTLLPEGAVMTTFDIAEIPLYNEDVRERGYPEPVAAFRAAIAACDALILVTPEYNYSVPGVLKNALDWASRPPSPPFAGKVAATLGASPGMHGTVRGQNHLKEVLRGLGCIVQPRPEVYVGNAPERFNAEGELTHEDTRKFVRELLANTAALARKLRAG